MLVPPTSFLIDSTAHAHNKPAWSLRWPSTLMKKRLFLSCHIPPPLTGNLIIDGWKRSVEWQESCRLLSFECICHLAGGGTDKRQLSWILNRQERRVGWRRRRRRQEVKSKISMIDRHWKWRWDSHHFLIMPVATMCLIPGGWYQDWSNGRWQSGKYRSPCHPCRFSLS